MPKTSKETEIRAHYDFAGGVRGKYAPRYARGSNVVVLDPDVARAFPTATAVNRSLRALRQLVLLQKVTTVKANGKDRL